MKNYNIIERGEDTIGKVDDILNYLMERKRDINAKYMNAEYTLEELIQEEKEIVDTINEIMLEDYQKDTLIRLFKNNYEELCWCRINI